MAITVLMDGINKLNYGDYVNIDFWWLRYTKMKSVQELIIG